MRDLLGAAATLFASALGFDQRLRQATARAERLQDLARVAEHLLALLDVESLPQAIAEEAARFLRAGAAVFRVLEGEHLRLIAQTGGAGGAIASRDLILVGESLSGTVAAQGEPVAIADLAGETRMLPAHREAALARGYRAYLGLPLHRSGHLVGVLSLYATQIGAFGPEDVTLGMGLAEQVALALEKAELLRRERQQGDRLRALHALTRAVGGSLDLQEIFRQVAAAAAELLEVPFARLWLLDESGEELYAQAEVMDRTLTEGAQRRLAVARSLIGSVVRGGGPVAVYDVLSDGRWQNREWARRHGLMSLLATPLVLAGRVRGVLSVLSRAPRRFGEEEQALIAALAQHAAIAIQNAQLLHQAHSGAAKLRTLTQLGRAIAGTLDPTLVFSAVVGAAGELLEVPHAVLWLPEAGGGTLRQQAEHLAPGAGIGPLRLPAGLALASAALQSGEPVLVPALATDPRVGLRMAGDPDGGLAFAAVPLRLHERVLGALGVFSPLPGRLDAQAMDLLACLADHAAVAIKNAQLYAEANRKAEQTAALVRVARTLAGSLDLPQVFATVVEAAVSLTGDAVAALWVLESDGTLSLGASSGFSHPEARRQTRFRVGEGIVGEVAERRKVLLISDVQADQRLVNRELAEAEGLRANAGLPLLVGDRCVGVLDLKRRAARAFSAEELAVLTSLADHAAIAIANARLYQEARRRAERLTAMAAVARTLTSSLEERAVFECIVRAAVDLLGGDMARLWVHDEARALLRVAAGAGAPDFPLPPRDTFAPGEGLVGTVFAERAPRVVVDPEREPIYAQQAWAAATGVRAAAAVPVLMGERALGVLSVV
ncbi:MAG: GAF domain-containing protein, partial [candidate division NC10 bacterium]|nr:GAF domain-containing protein [candidate division NC10 bacterium]